MFDGIAAMWQISLVQVGVTPSETKICFARLDPCLPVGGVIPGGRFFCPQNPVRSRVPAKNELSYRAKRLMRVRETGVAECGENGALQMTARVASPVRLRLEREKGARGGYEKVRVLSLSPLVLSLLFKWNL